MDFEGVWTGCGVVSRDELEAAGVHLRARRALIAEGRLRPFAPKVFLFGEAVAGVERWRQLTAATLLAAGPDAVLSRSTAAALWALDGLPVTRVAQTLVELGTRLSPCERFEGDRQPVRPDELVELAMESALRRGLVTEAELAAAASSRAAARQGACALARCLARRPAGAPATESYLETRGVQLLRWAGLPTGQRQVDLRDERGAFIARADLLLPGRLVLEFDGRAHHARVEAFERDRARWDWIVAAGYGLLVYTADQVERQPRFVADTVAAALRARATAHPIG
jgi:hypothetical protein